MITACGGGGSKSGLPSNEHLGNIPALYADFDLYEADLDAQAEEIKKGMTTESAVKKAMEWQEEKNRESKEKKAAMEEAVKSEWAKIAGKDVPFSTSEAFNQLNMQVNSVKFGADVGKLVIDLVAKNEAVINLNNLGDYTPLHYRVLAQDGTVIPFNGQAYVFDPTEIGTGSKTFAAGQSLKLSGDLEGYLHARSDPAKFANFASIEFITQAER
jgi:hypothetical protein